MSTHGHSTRDRIVDALMDLAAEQDWDRIEITEIAERAGVDLRRVALHHAGRLQAPDSVGGRTRGEVHPLPQLAPADPTLDGKNADDPSVDLVDCTRFFGHETILTPFSSLNNGPTGRMMLP